MQSVALQDLLQFAREDQQDQAQRIFERVFDSLMWTRVVEAPMATSNSPTRGHPKFPQARRPDYDGSGLMARRAAASLRR